MKINVKKIPPEGLKIEEKENADIIDIKEEGLIFTEPVSVSLFAQKAGGTLLVEGVIGSKANLECGLCLKQYRQVLEDKNFSQNYDITGKDEVDITWDIREGILLQIPIKPLCKKDCKGLCPKCGQDLNIKKCSCKLIKGDIRWGKLDELKIE